MSKNNLEIKKAYPYARALLLFVAFTPTFQTITEDFVAIRDLCRQRPDFLAFLKSPVVSKYAKRHGVAQLFLKRTETETFRYLIFLVNQNKIGLLPTIVDLYINEMYKEAKILRVHVVTSIKLHPWENIKVAEKLYPKIEELIGAARYRVFFSKDESLIGGILIKTKLKQFDFTVKTRLKNLAKHLDTFLDI